MSVELNERFAVTLASPSLGATITKATAIGVIYNDDAKGTGTLSIARASAAKPEGNIGTTPYTFTVSRTGSKTGPAAADWKVTGGGVAGTVAVGAADFASKAVPSGSVAFLAGQDVATVTVNVAGDAAAELNESFTVTLSNAPTGVGLGTSKAATGVIQDDDTIISTAASQTLTGTDGADVFLLGGGLDAIVGNAGLDAFRFLPSAIGSSAGNATAFQDFSRAAGEKLDLSRIDAIAGTLANDPFSFIGAAAFGGVAGQLRWQDLGASRVIQGDVNGDMAADLTIYVAAAGPVDSEWFVL